MRTASAALAVVALVMSGCSGGTQEPAATATSALPSTAAAAGTPTFAPTAVTLGPVTFVACTEEDLSIKTGTATTGPDGTTRSHGGYWTSTLVCPDKRVAGVHKATWSSERWGSQDNGGLVQWGRSRITNSGGRWVGSYTGVYTSETMDHITWWLTGTGGYKGLSMYVWESNDGPEAEVRAFVFPGKPPPS